ncbi:helix-turn-helix transcriptional regulator [Acerihabitans sp. KWT182]|uniref:Helix-turn-helix transcriptional regulator n=1 Tax=Acerihabitans sp. KWT182 TaxID=3157919 RepID=A0AAU7Q9E9_9GAMM
MEKKDWHKADIIAALRKKGTTLAGLSRAVGLSASTLANVLNKPWPKGEWVIGGALDMHPAAIWPSRYFDEAGQLIDRKKLMRTNKLNLSSHYKKAINC